MHETTVTTATQSGVRSRDFIGITAWVRWAAVCALLSVELLVAGCRGDVQVVRSSKVESPDNKWIASSRTDQHGGPGNAAVVTGVFLAPLRDPSDEHLILNFFDDGYPANSISVSMQWLTPHSLQVTFNRRPNFNFQVIRYADIDISVQEPQ
jgi:hypothetical protein